MFQFIPDDRFISVAQPLKLLYELIDYFILLRYYENVIHVQTFKIISFDSIYRL